MWIGNSLSLTITCKSGYELVGGSTLSCVEQEWEEVTQTCMKSMSAIDLRFCFGDKM